MTRARTRAYDVRVGLSVPPDSLRAFLSFASPRRAPGLGAFPAVAFPRLRRLGLLGTVVVLASAREARGHAGTRRAERTTETLGAMPSPGVRETHLPLVTGIDYEPVPEGAIRLPRPGRARQAPRAVRARRELAAFVPRVRPFRARVD